MKKSYSTAYLDTTMKTTKPLSQTFGFSYMNPFSSAYSANYSI